MYERMVKRFGDGTPETETETITINRLRFAVQPGPASGFEIRRISFPPIGDEYDLWLVGDPFDKPVADHDEVTLRDGVAFYTAPRVINNGSVDGLSGDQFPADYKARMIAAYPVIAQMSPDEFFYGDTAEREAAFGRILAAKNLRRTHEMFLSESVVGGGTPT